MKSSPKPAKMTVPASLAAPMCFTWLPTRSVTSGSRTRLLALPNSRASGISGAIMPVT
ncbi:unannotated protein [freshwater metagenome]|uniref:Unannotated protein n=1 Tax=freshwater metagenome TaxID=449393 RepID=A0A6J7EI27_9ZZZZ